MKGLFLICLFALSFSSSIGQEVGVVKSASDLTSIKEIGKGSIVLPSLTKEIVANNSKYYTMYFTIDFNDQTKVATIKMVDNSEENRRIITRFLSASNVKTVDVEGVSYGIFDMFEKYLK